MIAPSTYYHTEKKKYLVIIEIMYVWKEGMPTDVIEKVRTYDVQDGHLVDMSIGLFRSMVKEEKLKWVTNYKRK